MKQLDTLIDFDFYYKIFNTVANPVFVKDNHFRHILVNNAFCSQIGISREEIIGKTDDAFFPKKECRIFREKDIKVLTTGTPDENEEFLTLRDGTRYKLITRKSLLQTSDGERFILGIINDITDKVNLLNKLKESQKKYKSIFNLIPDPVGIFTYPGRIAIDVNDSFLRMSKVARKRIIGRQGAEAFRWINAKERADYFHLLEENHKVDNFEISLGLSDGRVVPFPVSARMIRLENQKRILFALRDISELILNREALKQSENLYKTIFNITQNIIILHINGKVIMVNNAITLRLGYSKEEVIGKNLTDVFRETQFSRKEDSFYKQYTASDVGLGNEVEFTARGKNGILKSFTVRTSKITYEGENAYLSVFIDITERKLQEKIILGKIVETEENERKRFAADIHDDLGPILSSIKLHLGIIENSKDDKKIKDNIELCYKQLNEVIGKVHAISDNLTPHLIEKYGIESAINAFCENFRSNSLDIRLDSNLGNFRFPTDFELNIYRIICELINNSIKHSGSSLISLKLHCTPKELVINYSDNGKGYQVEDILKESRGMGLHNIINRVNLINGEIEFIRKNGKVLVRIRKILD